MKHVTCHLSLVTLLLVLGVWTASAQPSPTPPNTGGSTNVAFATNSTYAATATNGPNGGKLLTGNAVYSTPPVAANGTFFEPKTPSGDQWGSMMLPEVWVYFEPWNAGNVATNVDSEHTITNYYNWMGTNGYTTNLLNQGYRLAMQLDIGWDYRMTTNNIPGTSYWMTNCGPFTWDTNEFPDGIPWLNNYIQTNGGWWGLNLCVYSSTNRLADNPGATGLASYANGSNPLYYTNGIGSGTTNGPIYIDAYGFKYVEWVPAELVNQVATEFGWWGIKEITINDCGEQSYPNAIADSEMAWTDAFKHIYTPQGFNQSQGASYFNMNLGVISYSATNIIDRARPYFLTNRMEYIPYETLATAGDGTFDKYVYGDWLKAFHNAVNYENYASPNYVRDWVNYYSKSYPSAKHAYEGARVVGPNNSSTYDMAFYAMIHGIVVIQGQNTNAFNGGVNSQYIALNNSAWGAVWLDPAQNLPVLGHDWTAGTGCMLYERLQNGDTAIVVADEGTNGWMPTITWNMIGLNTNDTYKVTKAFSYGESGNDVWPTTNSVGLNLSGTTNLTLYGTSSALLVLHQVLQTNINVSYLSAYTATNTLVVSSSGVTNTTLDTYLVSITAGTSMAVKDQNGNQYYTPVINSAFPLKPNQRFTGTAVTGTAMILNR